MPMRKLLLAATLLFSSFPSLLTAQEAPPAYQSVEVHPDRTVTFRYQGPGAAQVTVHFDGSAPSVPMKKGDAGLWQLTTPPLPPEIYGYSFSVDGRPQFDPNNFLQIVPNYVFIGDQFEVPGDGPQLWDAQDVPHGELHVHHYTTKVVQGLPANQNSYIVYTPPGYDGRASAKYPVLYLLHGWAGAAQQWTDAMQANNILDNLLAQKKIRPMVVVMPLGYGDMSFLSNAMDVVWADHARVDRNTNLFSQTLLTEILPQIEAEYNVSAKREDRAIAGLSMGGLESLTVGLNHTDQFAYIGGFSSAVHLLDPAKQLPVLADAAAAKAENLRLLWIACGVDDRLIAPNRKLIAYLKGEGLPVTAIETPGQHVFYVWRQNLIQFAPLLFKQ